MRLMSLCNHELSNVKKQREKRYAMNIEEVIDQLTNLAPFRLRRWPQDNRNHYLGSLKRLAWRARVSGGKLPYTIATRLFVNRSI